MRPILLCALSAVAFLGVTAPAFGLSLTRVGTYDVPTYVTSDPADPNRLFVVEARGRIRLTVGERTTTFVDLSSLVRFGGDGAMMSMAFAPDYAQSGRFYVIYQGSENSPDPGDLHVDELIANRDTTDPATRRNVLTVDHSETQQHYGGQLQFGPDGHFYISIGDGGPQGDPEGHAQDPTTLLGKLLRIDPLPGGGYTVPADNPSVGPDGVRDEIWSSGLRNPWRFSFDRKTEALAIADVGYSDWEEIDYRPQSSGGGRGNNFGWSCREGLHPFTGCQGNFVDPIFEYPAPGGCSAVIGGYVARDPGLQRLRGRYLYTDLCKGEIRSLVPHRRRASGDRSEGLHPVDQPTSFGEDACGRIYVVEGKTGIVYRIEDGSPTDCAALDLKARRKLRLAESRRIKLRVRSREPVRVKVEGDVTARSAKRSVFRLRTKRRRLRADDRRTVSWKLSGREARRCLRLMNYGDRVVARLTATAVDAAGGRAARKRQRVRLVLR